MRAPALSRLRRHGGAFARRAARAAARRLDRLAGPAPPAPPWWETVGTDEAFVRRAYVEVLGREVDPAGLEFHLSILAAGSARPDVLDALAASPEATAGPGGRLAMEAFHGSRVTWIRSLPPARRILDLGGTSLGDDRGALVAMGYPYPFDEVLIIDLPPDDRHDLYREPEHQAVATELGPVRYLYRSMADLGDLPDASFDLICSGQTFEHIYPDEGAALLRDVRRLLTPDGVLALDTPNAAVSSVQARVAGTQFINPDHKVEYTHPQMLALFADAGLRVVRAFGIGFMPRTVATDRFHVDELATFPGLYADIERCYTLAYLATPA